PVLCMMELAFVIRVYVFAHNILLRGAHLITSANTCQDSGQCTDYKGVVSLTSGRSATDVVGALLPHSGHRTSLGQERGAPDRPSVDMALGWTLAHPLGQR